MFSETTGSGSGDQHRIMMRWTEMNGNMSPDPDPLVVPIKITILDAVED